MSNSYILSDSLFNAMVMIIFYSISCKLYKESVIILKLCKGGTLAVLMSDNSFYTDGTIVIAVMIHCEILGYFTLNKMTIK